MSFDSRDVLTWYGGGEIPEKVAFPMIFSVSSAFDWKAMKEKKARQEEKEK